MGVQPERSLPLKSEMNLPSLARENGERVANGETLPEEKVVRGKAKTRKMLSVKQEQEEPPDTPRSDDSTKESAPSRRAHEDAVMR